MASFPSLSHGSAALYPLTAGQRYPARILQFGDDGEQRFRLSAPLRKFRLVYEQISAADVATVRTFFDSMKGAFDATWDLTIAGTTYSYLAFETDALVVTERSVNLFDIALDIRQVRKN